MVQIITIYTELEADKWDYDDEQQYGRLQAG